MWPGALGSIVIVRPEILVRWYRRRFASDDRGRLDLDLGPLLHEGGDLDHGHGGKVFAHECPVDLADFLRAVEIVALADYVPGHADHVLWAGAVINPEVQEENTVAIRAFNDFVAADPRVETSMIAVGDGLLLARKL